MKRLNFVLVILAVSNLNCIIEASKLHSISRKSKAKGHHVNDEYSEKDVTFIRKKIVECERSVLITFFSEQINEIDKRRCLFETFEIIILSR